MTVSSTATRIAYTGNASTTAFPFSFRFLATTDIAVYVDGVLQSTGYTVSSPGASGTVTFSTAPASGVSVVITRATAKTQETDYVANDAFSADSTELAFDRAMLGIQDNAAGLSRTLRVADYSAAINPIADPSAPVLAWASLPLNVTAYGAKGDGTTDDYAAFQTAINDAVSGGYELYIPSGKYLIGSPLVASLLSDPSIGRAGRFSIRGAGSGCTSLIFSGSGTLLTISGPTWGTNGTFAQLYVGGFAMCGQNLIRNGLKVEKVIGLYVEDVEAVEFDLATYLVDVVHARFVSATLHLNYRGMLCEAGSLSPSSGSPTNILTFVGCNVSNNRQYGYWFKYSAPVVFVGGSVESNGRTGSWTTIPKADRWDVRISNGGYNGVVALAVFGTHFETSAGDAFVIIDHTSTAATYLFSGADFIPNGIDFGTGAQWPNNCIKFNTTGASQARIVLHGCGFRGENGYTADASRRVVVEGTVSGTNHKFQFSGNVFWSTVDAPLSTLPREEFERGSNANGEYILYPDGTQICTQKLTITSGGTITWTFPAAFANSTTPSTSAIVESGGLPRFMTVGSVFNTQASFWGWTDAGAGANVAFYATATGRWF